MKSHGSGSHSTQNDKGELTLSLEGKVYHQSVNLSECTLLILVP